MSDWVEKLHIEGLHRGSCWSAGREGFEPVNQGKEQLRVGGLWTVVPKPGCMMETPREFLKTYMFGALSKILIYWVWSAASAAGLSKSPGRGQHPRSSDQGDTKVNKELFPQGFYKYLRKKKTARHFIFCVSRWRLRNTKIWVFV